MEKGRVGERIGVRRMRRRTGELAAGEGRSEQCELGQDTGKRGEEVEGRQKGHMAALSALAAFRLR